MASTIDFRFLDEGLGGPNNKRKRSVEEPIEASSMEVDEAVSDPPSSKRQAVASSENPDKPAFGRPSYDGIVTAKGTGRKWREPKKRRASAVQVSRKGTTFEQRAKEKEIKRAYRERMTELKEEIRKNKVEKRQMREERENRKQENILKSGTKFQVISNPKTLQKIAKSKDKKRLKVVSDDILKKK